MVKKKYPRNKYPKITHEQAVAEYRYDPETGYFYHKVRRSIAAPGARADHLNERGYLRIWHNSNIYLANQRIRDRVQKEIENAE